MDGYDGLASALCVHPATSEFDAPEALEVVLPADLAGPWPVGVFASDSLIVPDCPCCVEPAEPAGGARGMEAVR